MRLRFSSGSETPASAARKPRFGVDPLDVDAEMTGERRHDLIAFVEPEQAVVDEDAGQPLADGAVQQCRDHGGVDTAREREQDAVAADIAAHPLDAVVDDRGRGPARRAAADFVHEPAQNARALVGMGDLGMELDAVEAAVSSAIPAIGALSVDAMRLNPAGKALTRSPWLIHTSSRPCPSELT